MVDCYNLIWVKTVELRSSVQEIIYNVSLPDMYEKFSGDDIQNKCISEYAVSLMRRLTFLLFNSYSSNYL